MAQETIKLNDSKTERSEGIKCVHEKVGSILYYAISIDPTILMTLSTLVSKQSKATAPIIKNLHQLLGYLVTHLDTKI